MVLKYSRRTFPFISTIFKDIISGISYAKEESTGWDTNIKIIGRKKLLTEDNFNDISKNILKKPYRGINIII